MGPDCAQDIVSEHFCLDASGLARLFFFSRIFHITCVDFWCSSLSYLVRFCPLPSLPCPSRLPANYALFMSQSQLKLAQKTLAKTTSNLGLYLAQANTPLSSSSPSRSSSSSSPRSSTSSVETVKLAPSCSPCGKYPPPSSLPLAVQHAYAEYLSTLSSLEDRITSLTKFHRRHLRLARQSAFNQQNIIAQKAEEKAANRRPSSNLRWEILADDSMLDVDGCPPLSPTNSVWSSCSSSCASYDCEGEEHDDYVSIQSTDSAVSEIAQETAPSRSNRELLCSA